MNQAQEVSNHYPPPVVKAAKPARTVKTARKSKNLPAALAEAPDLARPDTVDAAPLPRTPARLRKQASPEPEVGMHSYVETHPEPRAPAVGTRPADAAFGPEFEQIRQAAFEAAAVEEGAPSGSLHAPEEPETHEAETAEAPGSDQESDVAGVAAAEPEAAEAEPVSESSSRIYYHPYSSPAVVFETPKPFPVAMSSPPPHNGWAFREAYSESFREAYEESLRDAIEEPAAVAAAGAKESYKRPWRSRFYSGPDEAEVAADAGPDAGPDAAAAVVLPVAPAQPSGPPWFRVLGARIAERSAAAAARARAWVRSASAWYRQRKVAQLSARRMCVIETLSLGDKRFLSVVQVDDCQFLVGGGAENIAVLAQLGQVPIAGESATRPPVTEIKV